MSEAIIDFTTAVLPGAPATSNQRPTFSVGTGIITTDLGSDDRANTVVVQADGKILVGGVTAKAGSDYYVLTRYNVDGSLDTGFNGTGILTTNGIVVPSDVTNVILLPDGKILLGGYSLMRVTTDGKIDSTFYTLGRPANMIVEKVSVQTDGKILLSGWQKDEKTTEFSTNTMVARLNADGTLDKSFNGNGFVEFNLGKLDTVNSAALLPNQKLLVVTYLDLKTIVSRLNVDGSLDSTFGVNGKLNFSGDGWAISNSIAVQSDGKFILTGQMRDDAFVARFNENGTIDTSFNGTGYSFLGLSVGAATLAIDIQRDGKIVVAGESDFSSKKFIAARFNSNGTLDTSFNKTGKLTLETGILSGTGVDIQSNGKIVFSSTKDGNFSLIRIEPDGSLDKTLSVTNSLNASVAFIGGGNAVVLDNDAKVYDTDFASSNNYANSSLVLERVGGANSQDIFNGSESLKLANQKVIVQGTTIGDYEQINGRLKITFNASATQELVSASMQQITYKNSNTHLSKIISINWTFNDGSGAANSSTSGNSTVTVSPSPNLNIPTSADRSITALEDVAYSLKITDFAFTDADPADSLQAIFITGLPNAGSLFLKGLNGTSNRMLDIADVIDVSDINAGRLQFQGATNANGNNYSSFRVKVSDGADTSTSATISINLTPVNDPPLGNVTITGKYTVGQTLSAANTLTDADGIGSISYQWKANDAVIDGAVNSNFVLNDTFAGKSISVLAQYTDAAGTRESVASLPTKSIGRNYVGSDNNDQFNSQIEDEFFNGGAGIDSVLYRGNLAAYAIKKDGNNYTVNSKIGTDGNDVFTNIETIKFSDININLGIQNQAAASPAADVQKLIELYISFFNRIPDANGLSYWIGEFQAGKKINQIAESFYSAGIQFPTLTGFSVAMTDTDFINTIYKNTLGRSDGADADGLNFWKIELSSGRATHGSLVASILNAAHGFKGNAQWGFVADLLDNKIAVGKTVAIEWGISYNTDADSISKGMAIAAAVTSASTRVALELVGVTSQDISLF